MTIQEVLEADWNVNKIDVTVRKDSRYIMGYCIGKDVKPGKSEHFKYETEVGNVYGHSLTKKLYIERNIQFYQLEEKPRGKEMCRGVLINQIPSEILNLEINYMHPEDVGWSDNLHGYSFNCSVDTWSGIPGEMRQVGLFN